MIGACLEERQRTRGKPVICQRPWRPGLLPAGGKPARGRQRKRASPPDTARVLQLSDGAACAFILFAKIANAR